METKTCSRCRTEKPKSEFYKDKNRKDELCWWCKGCYKEYEKTPKRKECLKEWRKEYWKTPKYKEYQKEYRKTPKCKEWRKEYWKEYIERPGSREIKGRWVETNREFKRELDRRYARTKRKIRRKERRASDPKFRLDSNMSSLISICLRGKKAGRRWEDLVDYTVNDLMKHLEKQFDEKMSWNNYGSYWWVDHRKPRALFNYIAPEDLEFKECWGLGNLQPMEKIENIKKGRGY